MSESQTFELTIFPGDERLAILESLASFAIDDFVESAGEVNADDGDWAVVFDQWSQADDSPILVYRSTRDELHAFIEHLQKTFGETIRLVEKHISDTLWQTAWEPDFQSLETERFFIAAPSVTGGDHKIRLALEEAAVFGSGQHATTQALVRLLEKRPVEAKDQASFLDIGTGTGVLCLVAHHLGYRELLGTDIEETAIANAGANASLNAVDIELVLGSLPPPEKKWTTIACNILPPTLTDLLEEMDRRLAPHGEIYLAGFNEANSEGVLAELRRLDYRIQEEIKVRGWIAWNLVKEKP